MDDGSFMEDPCIFALLENDIKPKSASFDNSLGTAAAPHCCEGILPGTPKPEAPLLSRIERKRYE